MTTLDSLDRSLANLLDRALANRDKAYTNHRNHVQVEVQSLKSLSAEAYQKVVYDSATIQCFKQCVHFSMQWSVVSSSYCEISMYLIIRN